jgi:dipeptidyl aminopeptidase/acylaminoacyl peptidase
VTPDLKIASDWSRDGAYLLFSAQSAETDWDIWALPMKGDRKPFPVVKTKFFEFFATISPDGRYIAYTSNESGRSEVYVQEFPEARNKIQVSTNGGSTAFWRADGRELFYRSSARVMAVPVQTAGAFSLGTPVELFQAPFASINLRAHYRSTPDGQRFLVVASLGREAVHPASVVLNWTAALK